MQKPEQQEEMPEWIKLMLKVIANMQKEKMACLYAENKLTEKYINML
jgi:hypothetical protein